MEKSNILCDRTKCTGCFACYNICPQNAIVMNEDECGYIYPTIDKEKCIECKMCKKVCSVLNESDFKFPIKCYAARTTDKDKLKKSTSGGLATILAEQIIKDDGVVYGAAYVENCEVNHIRVDKLEELNRIQGSKYVHSYINDIYRNVKKDLIENKKVLFIGTPCQVDGLKTFLNKNYDNLFLVDIICHGVPAQKFLKDEVQRLVGTTNVDRVNFRDKTFRDFTFAVKKKNQNLYNQEWIKSPYFYTFMKSITYRENCYSCKYAKNERVSDIMLGDFWGLGQDSKFYKEKDEGISVVFIITNKGKELFEKLSEYIEAEERKIDEAVKGNDQLREPSTRTKQVTEFKRIYIKNNNFFKSYKKVCKKNYYKQIIKSNKLVKELLRIRKEVKYGKK